jgi:hypothetical protein
VKNSFSPMETIIRELEHLESLIKLARWRKDAKAIDNQMSMVSTSPIVRKIYINKTNRNKTFHLLIKINNYVVEGLEDTKASMFIMWLESWA